MKLDKQTLLVAAEMLRENIDKQPEEWTADGLKKLAVSEYVLNTAVQACDGFEAWLEAAGEWRSDTTRQVQERAYHAGALGSQARIAELEAERDASKLEWDKLWKAKMAAHLDDVRLLHKVQAERDAAQESYAQLQVRCFDGGSQSVFDAVKQLTAERDEALDEVRRIEA
mgnify:CR=1 FL=1